MLARAAATHAGAKLFIINGPDVLSEYYGESEAGVRGIFTAARALAPSVSFLPPFFHLPSVVPAKACRHGRPYHH